MPILRKRADGGYIIRGFVKAARGFCTWQVSKEGVRCLEDEGIAPGQRLPSDLFRRLVDRGFAFTGQSGIVEAAVTPEFLDESPSVPLGTTQASALDDKDEKLLARWLPRLTDHSSDVREQAAKHLATLAVRNPGYRGRLVPLLLDFAVEEAYWNVVLNGLFFSGNLPSIPKIDAGWIDAFVDAYLEIGAVPNSKQHGAWRELQKLVQEGHLKQQDKRFRQVVTTAAGVLNGASNDSRAHIFAILDWAEDHG
jgi:hypothetical protein